MRRLPIAWLAGFLIAVSSPLIAAKPPDTWDGLLRVSSKKLDAVYLMPNADFRSYTKVIIDAPQIALRKNWQRDYNTSTMGTAGRISDSDVRRAIDEASERFREILSKSYTDAGYEVVSQPDAAVLRVSTAVINVDVVAPDVMTAGRSRTYAEDAGEATLALEARDSLSGALLGRALDRRIAGDNSTFRRTSVSNRADFDRLFSIWAKLSVEGLGKLKALSPVDADGALRK
ncbi:MAG TPA: DUF3313 family protein [Novosphingobium sp.]